MRAASRLSGLTLPGAAMDTEDEKGKMSGCEKGRPGSSLTFRIPCQGTGAVERRRLTCLLLRSQGRKSGKISAGADRTHEPRGGGHCSNMGVPVLQTGSQLSRNFLTLALRSIPQAAIKNETMGSVHQA